MKKGAPNGRSRGALNMHGSLPCKPRISRLIFSAILLVILSGSIGFAQSLTIQSIRVIGNRRIPKETIKARMFSHEGETNDPISIERDFKSLWNTGYFEDLRI